MWSVRLNSVLLASNGMVGASDHAPWPRGFQPGNAPVARQPERVAAAARLLGIHSHQKHTHPSAQPLEETHRSTPAPPDLSLPTSPRLGVASVSATANSFASTYHVKAAIPYTKDAAEFTLTNKSSDAKVVPIMIFETPILTMNKHHKVTKVKLVAEIESPSPGGAVPTGTVSFDVVGSHAQSKVIGKAKLKHGTATLTIKKPSLVLNQVVQVDYNGNSLYAPSESPPTTITSPSVPSARALVSEATPTDRAARSNRTH